MARHEHTLVCLENVGGRLVCKKSKAKKRPEVRLPPPPMTSERARQSILNRIDDEELHPDETQIRRMFDPAMSSITTAEIGSLIRELDHRHRVEEKRRTTSEREERWRQGLVRRLFVSIRALRDALSDRREEQKRTVSAADVEVSRRTGQETCRCGQRHPYGANFYVSAQDAGRTSLLRGPFKTHAEAIAAVEQAKQEAQAVDSRAFWYAYGTVAMPHSFRKPGVLDRKAA